MHSRDSSGIPATYYPVVRGTITAVNDELIDREAERRKRGDNLAREFNLTYREGLLEDERIVTGKKLFRDDWPEAQVSVLDTVLKMKDMKIGDRISFRIQGVPIEAQDFKHQDQDTCRAPAVFLFRFPR